MPPREHPPCLAPRAKHSGLIQPQNNRSPQGQLIAVVGMLLYGEAVELAVLAGGALIVAGNRHPDRE